MAIGKHSELEKDAYYTNNVSSKVGWTIVLGQSTYQNNNEFLEWKVKP